MTKCLNVMLLLIGCLFVGTSFGDGHFDNYYQEGKQYSQDGFGKITESFAKLQPKDLNEDYTETPAETKFYDENNANHNGIDESAIANAKADPTYQLEANALTKHSQMKVEDKAVDIQNSEWVLAHADELTHGKTCQEVPICRSVFATKTCEEEAFLSKHICSQQLLVDVKKTATVEHFPLRLELSSERNYIGANIDAVTGKILFLGPHDSSVHLEGRLPVGIDCKNLQTSIIENPFGSALDTMNGPVCENGLQLEVHISGKNHHRIRGALVFDVKLSKSQTEIADNWQDNCLNYSNNQLCNLTHEECSEPNATRVIDGVQVERACWKKSLNYECKGNTNIANSCAPLRTAGCIQLQSKCKTENLGQCQVYEQTFQCPTQSCRSDKQLICSVAPACIDGNCNDHTPTKDEDFVKAAGAISALNGAAAKFDAKQNFSIFSGHATSCSKAPVGFLNCCTDSGWGEKLNQRCDEKEKQLKQLKEQHVVIEVGDYCAHDVLGVCTSWRKRYCVFDTKLAKIVQEQGRKQQLRIDFGSAKSPNCRGLQPEELQRIDFDKIDFSDYANDIDLNKAAMDKNDFIARARKDIVTQTDKYYEN